MKKGAQTKAISREVVIGYLDGLLRGMRQTNDKNLRGNTFYYPYARSLGAILTCIEFLAYIEGKKRLITWADSGQARQAVPVTRTCAHNRHHAEAYNRAARGYLLHRVSDTESLAVSRQYRDPNAVERLCTKPG